jgi:hypothetical protein
LRLRICITLESRNQIRIKLKSRIRIRIKCEKQGNLKLTMEPWRVCRPLVQICITLMRSRIRIPELHQSEQVGSEWHPRHPSEKPDPDQDSDMCQRDRSHETNTFQFPLNLNQAQWLRLASTLPINSFKKFKNPIPNPKNLKKGSPAMERRPPRVAGRRPREW